MIVHSPTLQHSSGSLRVAARLEMHKPLPELPKELWYDFPEEYGPHLAPRTDAFAATALLVCMYAGEDLELRGALSPRLAYHLFEYRNIFHAWRPKLFRRVDIKFERLEALPPVAAAPAASASAFSGGVDSFYTLWSHRPETQPIQEARITHGLFLHGLDLRAGDEQNYETAAGLYKDLFDSLGLELILASTNAYRFAQYRINWSLFHGPPLIGAALLLSPLLGRFYIASSMPSPRHLVPQGNHPLSDHLLSTETLQIVHHGAMSGRYEKIKAIAQWPLTYSLLRVCARKGLKDGVKNCGACHKCVRTMAILEILGAGKKYRQNFQKKLSPLSYFQWGLQHPLDPYQAGAVRRQAITVWRFDIAFWVQVAIFLRLLKRIGEKLVTSALGREGSYRLKRRIYNPKGQGREKLG